MRLRVYLAGPIHGCSDQEAQDWREWVKARWPDTLDPMRRDYRGREDQCVTAIVEGDKEDIDRSDVLLVSYDRPSVGTAMEILYAWEQGIPVLVVASPETPLSPWLRYHAEQILSSFEQALESLRLLATQRRQAATPVAFQGRRHRRD